MVDVVISRVNRHCPATAVAAFTHHEYLGLGTVYGYGPAGRRILPYFTAVYGRKYGYHCLSILHYYHNHTTI